MEEKGKLPEISKDSASEIVIDYLKKKKETDKIDVAMVEKQTD